MYRFLIIGLLSISLTSFAKEKTICGDTDDRVLSNETEIGRASKKDSKVGCTATLIGHNCAISAGHCLSAISKVSFNVPQTINKVPQSSNEKDIYYLDKSFIKYDDNGEGKDWVVFKLQKNQITNLFPGDVQGHYNVRLNKNVQKGQLVRITGYGSDSNDPMRHFSQQTHTGIIKKIGGFLTSRSRLGYNVDTMGGNSGSSIILEESREVIGVHSHGTCGVWGDYNEGTLISKNNEFKQAIIECLREN